MSIIIYIFTPPSPGDTQAFRSLTIIFIAAQADSTWAYSLFGIEMGIRHTLGGIF